MLLANYLGAGRYNSALALIARPATSGVRQDELDRWIVLSGIQPMFELADEKEQAAAASRLRIARVGDPRWRDGSPSGGSREMTPSRQRRRGRTSND